MSLFTWYYIGNNLCVMEDFFSLRRIFLEQVYMYVCTYTFNFRIIITYWITLILTMYVDMHYSYTYIIMYTYIGVCITLHGRIKVQGMVHNWCTTVAVYSPSTLKRLKMHLKSDICCLIIGHYAYLHKSVY